MNAENHFEAIVREHYEPLFKFALRLTRAEFAASDLVQQTFYVWATKGNQLRDISKIKTWLFTTLHNVFLKERRREAKFIHEDLETVAAQAPVPCSHLDSPGDGFEALSALAKIDETYRAAVSLFYLNDCSYHEIVVILDVPLGTVKSRIARGIAQLRGILLSESLDSSYRNDESSSAPSAGKSAVPFGGIVVLPRRNDRWAGVFASNYSEGDSSSTLLPGTSSRLANHIRSPPQSAVN